MAKECREMTPIRINIVANTAGRAWTTLMGVGILPLYVRFLGAEAYGLIGLYGTIAMICSLFDAGISASLGRELARAAAEEATGKQTAELVRTAETLYLSIGATLAGLIALAAPFVASKWLNLRNVGVDDAILAVRLMGLLFFFQWSAGLYLGSLYAFQKQVAANVITSVATTIRAVGSVVVIWKISPSIVAFYWWQVLTTAAYMVATRETVWRSRVVRRKDAAFRWHVALKVRRFAAGVTLLSFLSVASSQLDKIVLTRLVSLESFGYYSFAVSVAGAGIFFAQPVSAALYPALIEALTWRDDSRLKSLFHRGAQLVSVTTFAPAAVLCCFAPVVLRLWARNPSTVAHASALVSVCLVGFALNGATVMPYSLALAAGRVGPPVFAASSGVIASAVALALLAPRIGVMAGAVAGALVSAVGLLVYASFVVRTMLRGQVCNWMVKDLLLPLSVAALTAALLRAITWSPSSLRTQTAGLLVASLATLLFAAIVTPVARQELMLRLRSIRAPRRS
jgi:O-antigen/teichoic acid export membrane protein